MKSLDKADFDMGIIETIIEKLDTTLEEMKLQLEALALEYEKNAASFSGKAQEVRLAIQFFSDTLTSPLTTKPIIQETPRAKKLAQEPKKSRAKNLSKTGSLVAQILIAMNELAKNGSKITSRSIRNQLVCTGNYTYDTLKLARVTSRINYLRSERKFIAVETKKGRETTYEFTEAGKKHLETMTKKQG